MLQKHVKICKTIRYLTENKLKKRKTPLLYHIAGNMHSRTKNIIGPSELSAGP